METIWLYELYVVATRPAINNGLGISSTDALQILNDLQDTHNFINDPDNLFTLWQQLIVDYSTLGKTAHDARLVAFMKAQGIESIYMLNDKDFNRYTNIKALFLRTVHAVTFKGFLLKLILFLCAFTLNKLS